MPGRLTRFPKRAPSIQQPLRSADFQLLNAAKGAYAALLLAVHAVKKKQLRADCMRRSGRQNRALSRRRRQEQLRHESNYWHRGLCTCLHS